jgi:hypothetical protein
VCVARFGAHKLWDIAAINACKSGNGALYGAGLLLAAR